MDLLRHMTKWPAADVEALGRELVYTGLATPRGLNHLLLDPGLSPYLRTRLPMDELRYTRRLEEGQPRLRGFPRPAARPGHPSRSLPHVAGAARPPGLFDLVQQAGDPERRSTWRRSPTPWSGTPGARASAAAQRRPRCRSRQAAEPGPCLESRAVLGGTDTRGAADARRPARGSAHRCPDTAGTGQRDGPGAYAAAAYDLAVAQFMTARILKRAGSIRIRRCRCSRLGCAASKSSRPPRAIATRRAWRRRASRSWPSSSRSGPARRSGRGL